MKVVFEINPVPASRPRVTRWSTFFPKKYSAFKQAMVDITKHTAFIPTDKLIYVELDFFVQIPKSWSKKKKASKVGRYCDNNADLDNYCKAILDSLEGIYYENDKQVVMIKARKFYSESPRIEYTQRELDEQERIM